MYTLGSVDKQQNPIYYGFGYFFYYKVVELFVYCLMPLKMLYSETKQGCRSIVRYN